MKNRTMQHFASIGVVERGRPRWLNVMAFVAALIAISGFGGSTHLELSGGSAKASASVALGTSQWTTNGPYGGQIRSIAIDPVSSATVYAGGIGGVFKSINGGLNWTPASNGIARYSQHIIVNTVAVSPANHDVVFAGELNGVYKSLDGGASWTTAGVDLIGSAVIALAIDPLDANKIYLSARDRIYRSVDGGNHWQLGFNGLNGTTPYSIAVAPGAVFTGTSNGLFKSTDGGVTWAATGAGFPVGNSIYTFTVLVDPTTPTTLYATPQGRQLYKSIDSGANWRAVGGPGGERFAIDSQTPTTMFLGGFSTGVSKSTDGGISWTAVNTGLGFSGNPRAPVNAIAVDSRLAGTVLVGSEGGVFRTVNGGNNWAAASTGLANVTVHVVAVDPLKPTTIYAGTRDLGIFKSVDGGASWADSSNGLYDPSGVNSNWVVSLAIDPLTPGTIYAGTNNFVFKSVDGGGTWKPARSGATTYLTPALAINPSNPKIIVAGTLTGGIYRSTDAAATWTQVTAGLPGSPTIYGLSFSATSPNTVLAAVHSSTGTDTYMVSNDSGATWSTLYPGYDPSASAISVIDYVHKTLGFQSIAIGYDAAFQPVYRQPYPVITGIDASECALLTSILFDPNATDVGYAGLDCGAGKGTSAQIAIVNSGLPVAGVKALALTPSGTTLYAGMDGGGVYQTRIDNSLGVMTEFYNPALDYYFITSRASDAALLDTLAAWRRTGKGFNIFIAQQPGTAAINRYYFDQIAVNKTRGSHFYTLVQSEKSALMALNPSNSPTPGLPFDEGVDSYAVAPLIEGVGGTCAAGLLPVYRIFRGQTRFPDNPNHRFITDLSTYNSFVALGWNGEGVKFCVPN